METQTDHDDSPRPQLGARSRLDGRPDVNRKTPRLAMLHPLSLILLGLSLVSCSTTRSRVDAPVTAEAVDLSLYIGRWYEIARLPMPFQKVNEAAIAEYGAHADGTISVHNIAIRPDGSQRDIRGYAKVLNPPENTKLTVRFKTWFGPLIPVPKEGNYWILHVDEDYEEAIVGAPSRKYLWLLARTSTISETRFEALVAKAQQLGFDTSRLLSVPHPQGITLQRAQP
jgi:apolipoprotein D and lipocalin family protein